MHLSPGQAALGKAIFAFSGLATLTIAAAPGQTAPARNIPVVTGDPRVDQLLSRMTLAEKLTLIHDSREDPAQYQGQAGYIAGIPRLGIPGLRLADGPPGVLTRHPSAAETATMGVAATFDVRLAERNGVVIGREARALGIDLALQPFINLDRDLAFKRAYNTFGEDPLLTSRIGAAEIRGIQSQRVMATAKHFISFDTSSSDVWIDDQTLHEVYLPPFEAAVHAGVAAVMCSYNHINGPYACGNAKTLTGMLRGELGFQGFVISDWGATHSAEFMNVGLDMEMIDGPDSSGVSEPAFLGAEPASIPPPDPNALIGGDLYGGQLPEEATPAPPDADDLGAKVPPKTIAEALKDGSVTEATVTRSAGRVLLAMARFGLLDDQSKGGNSRHEITPQAIEANARIIRQTGEEAAVLLKNEGVLPLKAADLDSVVLIGPTAGQVDAIGISGERSEGLPERQVGPLDALKRISGNPGIQFAVADDMTGTPVPANLLRHNGQPGLERKASGSTGKTSAPAIDPDLNFTLKRGNPLPPDSKITWTGTLTIRKAGTYWLYLQALGTYASLAIDGKRIGVTGAFQGDVHGDILQANQDNVLPTTDGLDNLRQAVPLTAGDHAIQVQIAPDTSNAPVQLRLNWYTPEERQADYAAAIAAARRAKIAIVFAWSRRAPFFDLGDAQNQLISEVAAVNPNTVVVLNTSQPVALPWLGRVQAVLEMWWPGDEGGWATANLLLGKANPAGRLPMTWAKRLADYPATDPRYPERSGQGIDHKTTYSEGVNVGYRWFDHEKIEPLFAFGHGLSYTSFQYSSLHVEKTADGGLTATFRLANTGKRDGDEVPQLYLSSPSQPPTGVAFAPRILAAFDRLTLKAGESKTVSLRVAPRQLQYWSTTSQSWQTAPGKRILSIGASSHDLRLQQTVE
jgi:beta-glucosidase